MALSLPATTKVVQWGASDVFKVGGKVFAICGEGLSFKVSEIAFEALTSSGRVTPSKYLARAHWVNLADLGAADAEEVADWVRTAYGLVAAKLPKKLQKELGVA